jgi:hypothetical protein
MEPPPPLDFAMPCADGAHRCEGSQWLACMDGVFVPAQTCTGVCDDLLGCVACAPNSGQCNGEVSHVCRADGSGYDDHTCDPVQGMTCSAMTGRCDGPCAPQNLDSSYVGCEYFPTQAPNAIDMMQFAFAVVVANTSPTPATVTIDGGELTAPIVVGLGGDSIVTQTLPWIGASTFPQTPRILPHAAYRLRSTQPVTVYQFNPLDYTHGNGVYSYSNDATLLLPTNALTGHYLVSHYSQPFVLVTAARDGVSVTVTPSEPVGGTMYPPPGFPLYTPTSPLTTTLTLGDVIVLYSGSLVGTKVEADGPVQVISGSACGITPTGGACDHMEDALAPIETLGKDVLVTAPYFPPISSKQVYITRVLAVADNTTLTYDPPQAGAPTQLALAGDFIDMPLTSDDVRIQADHKILVLQVLTGQNTYDLGDPATTVAVPLDQYRDHYLFLAPTNYLYNYVNVTAPMGAQVTLDGTPIAAFDAIGATGYGVARVLLTGTTGRHAIEGNMPFGIQVYGYGSWTAYAYAGGMNASPLLIP